ncbi:hypothetical protein [Nonomuraea insulae]|uniref:Serine/threonine protein kinase n=1 Tax=Nonomuraea insulae TaxID=1616787 RepID=A0ABW1DBJ8_9ACTN
MEFQGWSHGLALRPRDYLGKGESLAAVVRAAGPVKGEALYLLALGTATTMARLHLGGIAGLRLSPGNVLIGPRGQAFFAPGPRDSRFPANDVKDWADVIVFAATGRSPDEGADFDRLLPALRAVIEECLRPDTLARPSAVDLVRILLGHSGAARGATVHELLLEAEQRTRPYEPPPPVDEAVPAPFWRRPAYLGGIAIGVLIVAAAAGVVVAISGRAAAPPSPRPDTKDVVSAIGRRTATFHLESKSSRGDDEEVVADGRLSFAANAATSYEMKVTCRNAPQPTEVSMVGNRGAADGVPFDAERPPAEPCAAWAAPSIRVLSSPNSIKALLDAAGPNVSRSGTTLTGSALAHRIRGAESLFSYGEGPIGFTLQVDEKGLPVRLQLRVESRLSGSEVIETDYRNWRPYETVKGATTNG